jgi:hypothetical protein
LGQSSNPATCGNDNSRSQGSATGKCACNNTTRCNIVSTPSASHTNLVLANSEVLENCAALNELTIPSFTDSSKQIIVSFFRDLDQHFELTAVPESLELPLASRAITDL